MNSNARIALTGSVTEGTGDAKDFISLPGYMEQFENKLGYGPYPGTLNIDMNESNAERRREVQTWESITIDGWEDGDASFGPVFCLPATVATNGDSERYDVTHVIYPERTDHDLSTIEVVAPVRLRDRLDLSTGDSITIEVTKP